jgi:hypothetical protein
VRKVEHKRGNRQRIAYGTRLGEGEYDEEMAREGVVVVAFSVDGRSGRGLRF